MLLLRKEAVRQSDPVAARFLKTRLQRFDLIFIGRPPHASVPNNKFPEITPGRLYVRVGHFQTMLFFPECMALVDINIFQKIVNIIVERNNGFVITRAAHDVFLIGQKVIEEQRRNGKGLQIWNHIGEELIKIVQNMQNHIFMVFPNDLAGGFE